jgi:nitroreductase
MDMFLMSCIDAAIAGQSAAIATESFGLRICYVGAVRKNTQQMCELLKLPPNVFGLFGVAVGYVNPEWYSEIKPRLPVREVCHYEVWSEENQDVDVAPLTNRLVPFNLSNSSLVARVAVSL